MARFLGPSRAGNVFLFLAVTTTIGLFCDIAGVYFANSYLLASADDHPDIRSIASTVLAYGAAVGVLAGLLFGVLAPVRHLAFVHLHGAAWPYLIFLNILGLALARQLQGIFWGRRQFFLLGAVVCSRSIVYAVLALVVTYGLGSSSPEAVAGANVAATWVSLAAFLKLAKRDGFSQVDPPYLRRCLRIGWRAASTNVLTYLHTDIDQWVVNRIMGSSALGVYGVAVLLAELLTQIPNMLGHVILPLVAKDSAEGSRTLRRTALVLAVAALCAIPLAVVAPSAIRMLYGVKFEASATLMRYLLPGIVCLAGVLIVNNHVSALGYPVGQQILSAGVMAANIVLNVVLLHAIGIEGAPIASSITYALWLVALLVYFRRRTRLGST